MITKSALPKSNVQSLAQQAHSLSDLLERGQANKPLTDALLALTHAGNEPLVVSILCLDAAANEAISGQTAPVHNDGHDITCRVADCTALLTDIGGYQNFCRGSHVLLIAGSVACQLDQRQLEVVQAVSQLFPLLWPMVIGADASAPSWLPAVQSAAMGASARPTTLLAEQPGTLVGCERLQAFREPLFLQQRSATLSALLETLARRAEHELAYLAWAQSRLEVPAKTSPTRGAADCDKELAPLRERLAEQTAAIDRQLTLKSERSTQPLGELSGMMRAISNSIHLEDLDKSRSSALLKLSVIGSHLAHINRRIEHALRQEFVGDLQHVQRQVRQATDELLGTLCARLGTGIQVNLPVLDVNHAWRSVENLMAIGKETHIELARKGIFDILTAGRQKVFIIIMFASLMGRMGLPNLFTTPASKGAFGLFMAAVMIGSMVSAVLHWRREKQLTSEKELNKIRESLLTEGSKVIDQVERTKLAAMREYLKEAARTFDCTVKQSLEESQAAQRAKRELELQKQEAMRKTLDLRLKQTADVQRQVAKLLEQVRLLSASAARSLLELAARAPGTSIDVALAGLPEPAEKATELVQKAVKPIDAVVNTAVEPQAVAHGRAIVERPLRTPRATPANAERSRAVSALAERRQRRELARTPASDH